MDRPRVFFAYRDAPERREALRLPPGALERYRLFGLDQLAARAGGVEHNLEDRGSPAWARTVAASINKPLYGIGGYGGDFATVLASLRRINQADVVFSTVDTVGIPLILLKQAGLVRPPLVYVSIGLPERLAQLRSDRMQRLYARALRGTQAIVAYAKSEVGQLSGWLGAEAPPIEFVPFGVDVEAFRPRPEITPDIDVVTVGADPRRDFALLLKIAARRPELSFRIVASAEHARTLRDVPANVVVEIDIPLEQVRDRLVRARVVALPVRDNSYSGATTVLLQAMAMAKPVVVSRTAAISEGYELEDGGNCRLVPPGDAAAFERALLEQVTGAGAASDLGTRARQTVERSLSWERYTNALWQVLRGISPRPSG
ncbi:MAG TPA: glycosyltransferase family 4 protein [Gaiellaceae bacterium]|jgi:glycosyltransferase involved in cell wall biosynthesis